MKSIKIKNHFWVISTLILGAILWQGLSPNSTSNTSIRGVAPMLGEINMYGGKDAPKGWAFCEGQILDINTHSKLFSIIGDKYGGDGRNNFALPDLRERVPIGNDDNQAPGRLGQKLGSTGFSSTNETIQMTSNNAVAIAVGVPIDQASNVAPSLKIAYIIAIDETFSFPQRN